MCLMSKVQDVQYVVLTRVMGCASVDNMTSFCESKRSNNDEDWSISLAF